MKSKGLQELVKKVFGDEKARIQFAADPESVIARYHLTRPEKKALLTAYAKVGLANANSAQIAAAIDPYINWFSPVP